MPAPQITGAAGPFDHDGRFANAVIRSAGMMKTDSSVEIVDDL
jgi:hypothetical protein